MYPYNLAILFLLQLNWQYMLTVDLLLYDFRYFRVTIQHYVLSDNYISLNV